MGKSKAEYQGQKQIKKKRFIYCQNKKCKMKIEYNIDDLEFIANVKVLVCPYCDNENIVK